MVEMSPKPVPRGLFGCPNGWSFSPWYLDQKELSVRRLLPHRSKGLEKGQGNSYYISGLSQTEHLNLDLCSPAPLSIH